MSSRGRRIALIPMLFALLFAGPARALVLHPGDIVVTGGASTGLFVAVVDPITGANQIISQGGLLTSPFTVAVGADGFVYVGNPTKIIKVNPIDSTQSVFVTLPSPPIQIVGWSNMIAHSDRFLYYSSASGEVVRVDISNGALSALTSGAHAIMITEGPSQAIYASSCLAVSGGTCGVGGDPDIVARRHHRRSGLQRAGAASHLGAAEAVLSVN